MVCFVVVAGNKRRWLNHLVFVLSFLLITDVQHYVKQPLQDLFFVRLYVDVGTTIWYVPSHLILYYLSVGWSVWHTPARPGRYYDPEL